MYAVPPRNVSALTNDQPEPTGGVISLAAREGIRKLIDDLLVVEEAMVAAGENDAAKAVADCVTRLAASLIDART